MNYILYVTNKFKMHYIHVVVFIYQTFTRMFHKVIIMLNQPEIFLCQLVILKLIQLDKPRSHLAEYIFRLLMIEINSAIANNLKPIGMMKMQCVHVTLYPNIYGCFSDYMKIHHDCFFTFYGHFANQAR